MISLIGIIFGLSTLIFLFCVIFHISIILGLIILLWIIIGTYWFIKNLGNKHKKDTWIDWVLITPLLPVLGLFGMIMFIIHKLCGEKII